MSILKVAVALVLALSLVLGLALPALADSDKPIPPTEDVKASIVRGTVTEVDEANQEYFTVQSGEDEIGIRVDENTRYFMLDVPGRITALAQQLRLRNQAEVNAQVEQNMGLVVQNRVRAGALVQNQARLRAQNRVAQTETVPVVEPQQARLRVQNRVAQTETVPVVEPQQARLRVQNRVAQTETVPVVEPQQARLRVQNRVAQTETVSIELQPAIRYPFSTGAGFSDIEIGDRVVVWLADGESLAKRVLIVKPAARAHVGGTITGLTSETITIAPDDGEAVTLCYNEDTVFVLNGFTAVEEGQSARAVYETEHMLAERVNVSLTGD